MALIECVECKKQISDLAPACPHCGAPITPSATESQIKLSAAMAAGAANNVSPGMPMWFKLFGTAILLIALFSCIGSGGKSSSSSSGATSEFGWNDALTLCQMTLKKMSRDPEKAEVPYVQNHGSGDEYYFAWGGSTKMARMRNGLGLEVATSASCTVSHSQRRITSLTLDGKTIL